jgi:hypothetical protein
MRFFANLLSFQVCWVAFVWGGASGRWWLGFIPLLVFMAWQLAISHQRRSDLATMAMAFAVGVLIESVMSWAGWFGYATPAPGLIAAPLWMLGMWANFGLTINHSMAWFKPRLALGAVFGLLGAPLTYWIAGRAWNAVAIPEPTWPSLLAIGVAWAIAMPLLCAIAVRTSAPIGAAVR